jgi:mono/diheme cytochrome c family protein
MRSAVMTAVLGAALGLIGSTGSREQGGAQPIAIPRTWDDRDVASFVLPAPDSRGHVKHISADFYYQMPVRRVFKSYPVYHPKYEPVIDGRPYREWLAAQKPQAILGELSALRTEAEWSNRGAALGKDVFEAAIADESDPFLALVRVQDVRDAAWYERTGVPYADDGLVPFVRYLVTDKGVQVSNLSCAMCHTRVVKLPTGTTTVLAGAQGNFPFDRVLANQLRERPTAGPEGEKALAGERAVTLMLFATPWIAPDPLAPAMTAPMSGLITMYQSIPAGALARHGTSPLSPAQVPDLIGIRERRYLDRTGLVRHRDIGDIMRYAAANQDADVLAEFGSFRPIAAAAGSLPPASQLGRYSDEQLYALARFLYSLEPPPNPYAPSTPAQAERVDRGQAVFTRQGCAGCHTPPAYTSNKLLPVVGYTVPAQHPDRADILTQRIDTDPFLTMRTRRGTGFYKVPSLKGVWYRGPFEHNGSVATLEDWFDPRRLDPGYVPTGWKGPQGTKTRAVPGHRFGLALSADDRAALIAFLRSL